MSMGVITALQILGMFAAYSVISLLLPHIVVGKTLKFKNGYERFVLYTMFGNFYVINMVYLLELLHISYTVTLILLTVVPLAFIKIKLEHIPFGKIVSEKWDMLRRFAGGQLKLKALRESGKEKRVLTRRRKFRAFGKSVTVNIPDILLIAGLITACFYIFGSNLFWNYGYKLTDVVVHNYWINQLSENNIFSKGVYPFGYHNILYYMHQVFGFDTYVLLRNMNIVAVVWITLLLLCFLKLVCKFRFLPYIAAYAYVLFDYYESHTYARFCALIPQEYGMLFVLPTIYCAFAYFRQQRRETDGGATKTSYMYLAGFGMSFSMTLAVHFYATIATGVYIFAVAIGFAGWLFRKPYFKKLVITTFLALFVAILPMGIAYATGTELEYSLKWALSVITGNPVEREDEGTAGSASSGQEDESEEEVEEYVPLFKRNLEIYRDKYGTIGGTFVALGETLEYDLDYASIHYSSKMVIYLIMCSFLLLIILGICYLFTRSGDKIYGAELISTGVYMIFMTIMISAGDFNIPQLMDLNRSSIFFSYVVGGAVVMLLDGILYIVIKPVKNPILGHALSLTVLAGVFAFVISRGEIRERMYVTAFESNDAITCLTKIIKDNKDETWTICSANDEGRMVYNHGYHYELIDFLRGMEYTGSSGWTRIPTELVFFFVEKNPIDYYIPWEGSGTPIGEEHASKPLPLGNNRALYEGENRWICMSRYYYWAEAFRKLYPNETSVYYETDDFICYRVEQNTYRLFNFSIDYGYNVPDDVQTIGEAK